MMCVIDDQISSDGAYTSFLLPVYSAKLAGSRTCPVAGCFDLSFKKVLFLRSGERIHQADKPADPFLVADERRTVDVFIFIEGKLKILPAGLEVAIELEAGKLHHQADFVSGVQALPDRIQKLLVFLARHLANETHSQAASVD